MNFDIFNFIIIVMGSVSTVVEAVLGMGFLAEGIAETVLKEKISKLIGQNEEEFEIMKELSSFVEVIAGSQNSLQSQLRSNVLFVKDIWLTIYDCFEEKAELLSSVATDFPEIKTSDFNFPYQSKQVFGVSFLASAYLAYSFIAGKEQPSISQDFANFKKFFQDTSKTVQTSQPQIQAGSINAQGLIQTEAFGSDLSSVPETAKQSQVGEVKSHESDGSFTSKAVAAWRLISMGIDIYNFLKGIINLVELGKRLEEKQKYFEDAGEFQKAEKGILEIVGLAAVDTFNMANLSRSTLYQSQNAFLVRSITLPKYNQKMLEFIKQLDPNKLGLTQQFIQQCALFITNCNKVTSSDKNIKEKLMEMRGFVRKFVGDWGPNGVFVDVGAGVSVVMGSYSKISTQINEHQHKVNRFLTKVSIMFDKKRGQNFNEKPLNEKKQIDTQILSDSFNQYTLLFNLDLEPDTIDQQSKDILFQSLTSQADDFYGDDQSGKTLFGKNILESKAKISYKQLLDSNQLAKAYAIPVRDNDGNVEDDLVKEWVGIAKELNEGQGYKYWKQGDKVEHVFRYVRIRSESQTRSNGKEYKILSSFEGIRVKVNQQFFQAQRSVLRGTLTLKQA